MTDRQLNALLNYEALLRAGEALLSEGYDQAQPNKIAKAANVSVGLFYRHFSNKRHLLTTIIEYHLDHLHSSIEEEIQNCNNPKIALKHTILITLRYFRSHEDLIKLFFMEIGYGDVATTNQLSFARNRYRNILLNIIQNGISINIFVDETVINLDIAINSIVGTINWSIYNTLIVENKNLNPDDLSSQIFTLITRFLCKS